MVFRFRNEHAFTLGEVMVVVIIMGIVSALAIPKVSGLVNSFKMRTAMETIKHELQAARVRAVANPTVHCGVYFDIANRRSFLFFDSPTSGTQYQYDVAFDRKYSRTDSLPKGATFALPSTNPITNNCIVFRGDGSAKYGGGIEIRGLDGRTRLVNVFASTGRIRVIVQ
jgi:prepilin-type N-terminal cleavage/methylation domain-containing protein